METSAAHAPGPAIEIRVWSDCRSPVVSPAPVSAGRIRVRRKIARLRSRIFLLVLVGLPPILSLPF